MKLLLTFLATALVLLSAEFKPVMIYDSELLKDDSWNSMIHDGIERFKNRFNVDIKEVKVLDIKDFDKEIRKLAEAGYDPIMVNDVDDIKELAIKKTTLDYPKKRFIIFNGTINIPNADFFVFSYQEATFLAGYLAAKKSKTNTIGFVGGMEIPVIKNFLCGYIKGAKYANPDAKVFYEFIGQDFNAWNNPKKGYDLAKKQILNGADVVFGPAGGSSLGILKAAHDLKKLGIGVDRNQNGYFPGSVLTSVMVRVDNAAYMALTTAYKGIWRDNIKIMGLQEKGLKLTFDKYNESLISTKLREELDKISADIILKKIKLPNYTQTKECSYKGEKIF